MSSLGKPSADRGRRPSLAPPPALTPVRMRLLLLTCAALCAASGWRLAGAAGALAATSLCILCLASPARQAMRGSLEALTADSILSMHLEHARLDQLDIDDSGRRRVHLRGLASGALITGSGAYTVPARTDGIWLRLASETDTDPDLLATLQRWRDGASPVQAELLFRDHHGRPVLASATLTVAGENDLHLVADDEQTPDPGHTSRTPNEPA